MQEQKGSFLIRILIGLVTTFVVMQLYILTSIGTQGERVSAVRTQQSDLKIENEIKRARILELQSNDAIKNTVQNLQMYPVKVEYIDVNYLDISAQQ